MSTASISSEFAGCAECPRTSLLGAVAWTCEVVAHLLARRDVESAEVMLFQGRELVADGAALASVPAWQAVVARLNELSHDA